ncbi:uncharacterized protein PHALS_14793 [Plasmopara halstedii]|uniref:Uncharacterized protein n=1 Tax=Plasmopara halstedii TaxID=4781 RepID=A0A0P1ASU6_PLAHL|nr:uncharacterized protein PHALS_14793 [Plasmopara halstedii]CEG45156.1 hypothetical protein PHALS_14793 [Plasmopara halstedii]|eukprot:XP_024581525.1 hypothetical protein PHALS_14793 [Plasmopara halstedii]
MEFLCSGTRILQTIILSLTISSSFRFVQLFVLKQLHCEMLSPHKLRQMAEICFDKCAVLQRHLQFCGTNEASSAQLMKEMLTLSQQGYRLQALTDGDQSSNIPKSSRVLNADVCGTTSSLSNGTRFIITIPFREKVSTCPLMAVRRG